MLFFKEPIEFEWDRGNRDKNFAKHKVTDTEAEEAFFDEGKRMLKDVFHSNLEDRYLLLGKTKGDRLLFVVFTIRADRIRIISARDVNKKERSLYEENT